jgi:hypothetical protein
MNEASLLGGAFPWLHHDIRDSSPTPKQSAHPHNVVGLCKRGGRVQSRVRPRVCQHGSQFRNLSSLTRHASSYCTTQAMRTTSPIGCTSLAPGSVVTVTTQTEAPEFARRASTVLLAIVRISRLHVGKRSREVMFLLTRVARRAAFNTLCCGRVVAIVCVAPVALVKRCATRRSRPGAFKRQVQLWRLLQHLGVNGDCGNR